MAHMSAPKKRDQERVSQGFEDENVPMSARLGINGIEKVNMKNKLNEINKPAGPANKRSTTSPSP